MGKIAFVFAGQGAQKPGMGKELYEDNEAARAVFDRLEALRPGTLAQCFEGPAEELNITVNTQPCLFAVDLACASALMAAGVAPQGAAGFSLGEIPALAVCGLLTEEAAFDLVQVRAAAMHEAGTRNKGEMYAVLKLLDTEVEAICAEIDGAWPVNFNFDRQTVVACREESGPHLVAAVAAAGGDPRKLPVSGAFHSPLMAPATDALRAKVSELSFADMAIPLYSNVTAAVYGDNPGELLVEQVTHPIQWKKIIENMIADGFDTFIEVGAGRTLSGFIRKINPEVRTMNVGDLVSLEKTLLEVADAE